MNFIICIAIAWILSYYGNKVIRKYANLFYMIATTISVILIIGTAAGFSNSLPAWLRNSVWSVFAWGSFATALFVLVMFAGAVPKGSVIQKTIIPIRKELSIIASILTLGHNFSAGQVYFIWLFTKPERLQGPLLWATFCSIALILLMLPLFVTSFTFVRKKMKPKSWKNLQRLSYPFYGLIYIHVLLLFIPKARMGHNSSLVNVAAFSVVFLIYAAMRIQKALNSNNAVLKVAPFVAALAICGIVGVLSMPVNDNPVIATNETANAPKESQSLPDKEATSPTDKKDDVEATQQMETAKTEDTSKSVSQDVTPDDNARTEETKDSAKAENANPEKINSQEPKVEDSKQQDIKPAVDHASEQKNTSEAQTAAAPKEVEKPVEEPKKEEKKTAETSPEAPKTNEPKADTPKEDAPAPQPAENPVPKENPAKEAPAPEPTPEPAPEPAPVAPVFKYKSGQFSGSADGYNGPITVSVTIQDDVITAITISAHSDDEPFITNAKAITGTILSSQSTNINTISGATFSSRGIKEAVAAALNNAKN
ncbi:FMN-binding protein [Clostridiales bacterium COT073_COT-073]|nr:FMN-binding protein [Clostridiales bacterium COT073_COT-073]